MDRPLAAQQFDAEACGAALSSGGSGPACANYGPGTAPERHQAIDALHWPQSCRVVLDTQLLLDLLLFVDRPAWAAWLTLTTAPGSAFVAISDAHCWAEARHELLRVRPQARPRWQLGRQHWQQRLSSAGQDDAAQWRCVVAALANARTGDCATLLTSDWLSCDSSPAGTRPSAAVPSCRDPDDQKFLDLAANGSADLLLTRDRALLRCRRFPRLGRGGWGGIATIEQARALVAVNGRPSSSGRRCGRSI